MPSSSCAVPSSTPLLCCLHCGEAPHQTLANLSVHRAFLPGSAACTAGRLRLLGPTLFVSSWAAPPSRILPATYTCPVASKPRNRSLVRLEQIAVWNSSLLRMLHEPILFDPRLLIGWKLRMALRASTGVLVEIHRKP